MADETTPAQPTLPPQNVDPTFRPYYALLVDRAISEYKAGRSETEVSIELQKITPPKAVTDAGIDPLDMISEAIRYARSVLASSPTQESVRLEPIIEQLGSSTPPKQSDLFLMLKQLRERERLIRTAGFEAQRSALRESLNEIKGTLENLKVPSKIAGAFPFNLAAAPVAGVASSPTAPSEFIPGAEYSITVEQAGIFGPVQITVDGLVFKEVDNTTQVERYLFSNRAGAPQYIFPASIRRVELVRVPAGYVAPQPAPQPGSSLPAGPSAAPSPTASAPLAAGQESLTLTPGTQETRAAVDAKIAAGYVMVKVVSRPDGLADFIFERVSGAVPAPAPVEDRPPMARERPVGTVINVNGRPARITGGYISDRDVVPITYLDATGGNDFATGPVRFPLWQ